MSSKRLIQKLITNYTNSVGPNLKFKRERILSSIELCSRLLYSWMFSRA